MGNLGSLNLCLMYDTKTQGNCSNEGHRLSLVQLGDMVALLPVCKKHNQELIDKKLNRWWYQVHPV